MSDGFALALHCGRAECEDDIKAETTATPRCIPTDGAGRDGVVRPLRAAKRLRQTGGVRGVPTDPVAAFADEAGRDVPDVARLALLIAAVAQPGLDVDAELAVFDALALGCPAPTFDAWHEHMWTTLGFRGDTERYGDPRNSFLNEVIARRTGIPITLAVAGIEVGRRAGVPLTGIGMPGHFLLRHDGTPNVYVDPFAGTVLDEAGCRAIHRGITGAPWEPDYLAAASPLDIAARMLANLRNSYRSRGDERSLEWVLQLRTLLPSATEIDRADLVRLRARWN